MGQTRVDCRNLERCSANASRSFTLKSTEELTKRSHPKCIRSSVDESGDPKLIDFWTIFIKTVEFPSKINQKSINFDAFIYLIFDVL